MVNSYSKFLLKFFRRNFFTEVYYLFSGLNLKAAGKDFFICSKALSASRLFLKFPIHTL